MSTQPKRPGTEIDEETKRILDERDATFEQDARYGVDAREALKEIRAKLKQPMPA